MPKFYCEYCDVYLAIESVGVRRQHRKGRKHKDNMRAYYLSYIEKNPETVHIYICMCTYIYRIPAIRKKSSSTLSLWK